MFKEPYAIIKNGFAWEIQNRAGTVVYSRDARYGGDLPEVRKHYDRLIKGHWRSPDVSLADRYALAHEVDRIAQGEQYHERVLANAYDFLSALRNRLIRQVDELIVIEKSDERYNTSQHQQMIESSIQQLEPLTDALLRAIQGYDYSHTDLQHAAIAIRYAEDFTEAHTHSDSIHYRHQSPPTP